MDIFCLPSCYEGLGIVLIEAQASGLPCVVSNMVPREVSLTENIEFVPLEEEQWVSRFESRIHNLSQDRVCNLDDSGYEITKQIKIVEALYQEGFG